MTSLPEIYAAKVADGSLTSDDAQTAVLPEFERIRAELAKPVKKSWFRKTAPDPVQGLYLWGGVGRGKSMLMDLFVDSLDVPVRRVHFHAFMQEIHEEMHKARSNGVEDPIQPVAKAVADSVRVLAFDEMQITDITDAMIVGRLFEQLFEAGVVVVTTSNRIPDDLYKDGLNRQLFLPFIAIIKEQLRVWELVSPTDYRQNRLAGNQVYFVQAGTEARAEIRAIWEDLTCGPAEPLVLLTVNSRAGRTLPAFRNGVLHASFVLRSVWRMLGTC